MRARPIDEGARHALGIPEYPSGDLGSEIEKAVPARDTLVAKMKLAVGAAPDPVGLGREQPESDRLLPLPDDSHCLWAWPWGNLVPRGNPLLDASPAPERIVRGSLPVMKSYWWFVRLCHPASRA